jgi:methionine aminopeptidase
VINLKSAQEIDLIARGGAIIGGLLREIEGRVAPGVSTAELDTFCEDYIPSCERM